jgi:hypothetical protein
LFHDRFSRGEVGLSEPLSCTSKRRPLRLALRRDAPHRNLNGSIAVSAADFGALTHIAFIG